jgi:PAS domain S-box-containing protein
MLKNDKVELLLPDVDMNFIWESTPGYIYWKNLDSIYVGCNPNFANLISSQKISDIIGLSEYEMPWAKLNPTVAEHNVKADKYIIETGRSLVTEEQLSIKNEEGFPIIVRSEKRPLRNKQGEIVGIIGVSLDITKQKKSENLLTDINFIIDAFPGYVYWKDLNSVYRGCNQTFALITGVQTADEMIGKTDYEWVDATIADKYVSDDQYVMQTGKVLVVEDHTGIKNSKGIEIIVRTEKKPFFDNNGNVVGVLGIAVDITDEKDLKNSEIDRDLILNSTPGYVYWKNLDSVYIGCNQEFLQVALTDDIRNVIGKTDYTLPWGVDPEIPPKFIKDDQYVISTGNSIVTEDSLVIKNSRGLTILVRTEKKPLYDKKGKLIGVLGIAVDITDQKETERLRLETQNAALLEKEKLITLAHTVAHDISSPLSALNMMMHACDELPESKRNVLKRAIESILDIANNLLSTYRNEEQRTTSEIEQRQPLLISDLIVQLLSEKKVQFSNHAVKFETEIANDAQFAFAQMQSSQFRRSMSNLINNAVDALDNKSNGLITIKLTSDAGLIFVAIQDNGKGMPSSLIQKMLNRQSFTEGKEQGHGLGLQQVWGTLDNNQGTMNVTSTPNEGTTIQLTFPRIAAESWIAQTIHLVPNSIIVILDDEESIHGAWDARFAYYLKLYPTLNVHHFKQGQEALDFFNTLSPKDKDRVVFLSDYELLRQAKNGLQIIEESGIQNTTLVTSYYSNTQIRDKAIELGVKILPKQMASIIPIEVDKDHQPPSGELTTAPSFFTMLKRSIKMVKSH